MSNAIIEAIETRASVNIFDACRPLSDTRIARLADLATRAPTAFNLQNWRLIAVRTPAAKTRLQALAWNQPKVGEAAAVFIVCGVMASHEPLAQRLQAAVDQGVMHDDVARAWVEAARGIYAADARLQRDEAVRSASLCAATLMMAAQGLGLASAPMTGFDAVGVADEFGLGPDEVPVMLVAVGHAGPGNGPQKPRRPIDEVLSLV